MSNLRQYDEKTGKLIRHKVWKRGRKARSHIIQIHNDFNRDTHQAISQLHIRLKNAEAFTSVTRQMVDQFIQMAMTGIRPNGKKDKKHDKKQNVVPITKLPGSPEPH